MAARAGICRTRNDARDLFCECERRIGTHGKDQQAVAGVGKRYFGGGMGICNAMVFGRIAGTQAAAEARARKGA